MSHLFLICIQSQRIDLCSFLCCGKKWKIPTVLCNMHHFAVDCLRLGLCFLGKYHILAGKLLSRTVEVWTSADNFNILHFSYMKLSCYSRHCRKILTWRFYICLGINEIDELSWQMKHMGEGNQSWDPVWEMLNHLLRVLAQCLDDHFGNYPALPGPFGKWKVLSPRDFRRLMFPVPIHMDLGQFQ